MTNRIVSWNPFEKHQFVLNGAKLDFLELCDEPELNERESVLKRLGSTEPNQLSCIDWHPCEETSVLSFGTIQGEVHLKNWRNLSEVPVCMPAKNARRACNSLAWNKQIPTQLAGGFESVKSEYCAVVWDFEHKRLQRVSTGESVTAMAWLPDSAHLLVTGTAIGWVRVHDIRTGNQQPAISFMAHPGPRPRKVKGIRSDPFHHNVFATFSDGAGDVVRLWDLRKHYTAAPKSPMSHSFTVVPSSGSAVVQDVAWSTARPHVLATATSGQRGVSFFSTSPQHNEEAVTIAPLFVVASPEPVRSLSWRGLDARHVETFNAFGTVFDLDLAGDKEAVERARTAWEGFKLDETLHQMSFDVFAAAQSDEFKVLGGENAHCRCPFNNLLVATTNGLMNVEVKERAALAVSTAGVIAAGRGDDLQLSVSDARTTYPLSVGEESTAEGCLNNTAQVMQYRAAQGYSIDETKNLEVLAGELDHIYTCIHSLVMVTGVSEDSTRNSNMLNKLSQTATSILEVYKVYVWADRFEALTNQTSLSLVNCGVLDIIQNETRVTDQLQQNYRCLFHNVLGADMYLSKSRFLCKKICGWIGVLGLEKDAVRAVSTDGGEDEEEDEGLLEVIVSECLDGFERAAAIALWHGDINLAVHVLHRAIDRHEANKSAPAAVPATLTSSLSVPPLSPKGSGINNDMTPLEDDGGNTPQPRDYRHGEEDEESNIDWDHEVGDDYMKLVSLVGMCLAGYNFASCSTGKGSPGHSSGRSGSSSSQPSAWAGMCKHVLGQLQHSTRRATSYLIACCVFLLANINEFGADDYLKLHQDSSTVNTAKYGIKLGYRAIVEDTRMLLEDRIAFAATFFANSHAVDWFIRVRDSRKQSGRLDGILITGLSSDGLDILQQYVDRFEDIQTVALLVSRIIDSASLVEGTGRPAREWIWLHEYRNLLNKWGLFIERAKLDVELGKRYRSRAAAAASALNKREAGGMMTKGGRGGMPFKGGSSKSQQYPFSKGGHQTQSQDRSKRVMYKLSPHSDFPHIYLRCSYCGTSLPVDGMQTNKAESLRSQKSVLNCCAGCSKQLPRCYVCQLYMGMVNPYRELNRTMTQKRINADKLTDHGMSAVSETPRVAPRGTENVTTNKKPAAIGGTVEASQLEVHAPSAASHHSNQLKSDHNVIDFGRWFFFCQHCRHGGHATCIDQWFGGANSSEGRALNDFNNLKSTQRIVCGVNGCNCNCKARR